MARRLSIPFALGLLGVVAAAGLAFAETQGANRGAGTEAQAARGRAAYQGSCAACHGAELGGGAGGPPLASAAFRGRWRPQTAQALFDFLSAKMPPGNAGSLPPSTYADLAAYILKMNGAPAGQAELAPEPAQLAAVTLADLLQSDRMVMAAPPIRPHTPLATDAFTTAALKGRSDLLAAVRPVTDAMLAQPAGADWLAQRGSYASQGYSALSQIDRENVGRLQPAWGWQLAAGLNEVAPIVHDGVLFVASAGRLEAFDAASGDRLWSYTRPGAHGVLRGISIYGDKIYFPAETTMVALDIRTGQVAWEHQVAAPDTGVRFSTPPVMAKGKVLQGMGNCYAPHPGGCFIVALDAQTGQEAWRFNTIARPGEPGGDTWNGAPLAQRQGASVWQGGSYDPDLDLVFFGTSQTYRTATLIKGKTRADGLYTDTTLAFRPETGELAWHYQHFAGDIWDLDWAFERVLATQTLRGVSRRTVTTGNKAGIFDTLDAATGRYLYSTDLGLQTLVKSIDRKTGAKIVDPKYAPQAETPKVICPGVFGGRDWPSTAYNPASGVLFIPINEMCTEFTWVPGGDFDWASQPVRLASDGMVGRVQAIDLASGKTLWTMRERSPHASAVLATAGGLIFEGNRDRWFRALDDRTGKVLWQTRLEGPPSSFPMTYSVNGVQYVAVTVGGGNYLDTGLQPYAPEVISPTGATTLLVFRLPAVSSGGN